MDNVMIDSNMITVKGNDECENRAMNIVISTLKERCYLLQRRLRMVEEENLKLSQQCGLHVEKITPENDVDNLNACLTKLSKENTHLTQRLLMMARENKNLWTRLTMMASSDKEKTKDTVTNCTQDEDLKSEESKATIPQLIRSQTFTQPSPNPMLRAKIEEMEEDLEPSLDTLSLKIINGFLDGKTELYLQYEQMVELQKEQDHIKDFGFNCLEDYINHNSVADIKTYTQKLMGLKNVVLQHQADLKDHLKILKMKKREEKLARQNATKNTDLPKETAGLESPEIEVLDSSTRWATPANSTSYHDNIDDSSGSQNTSKLINNIQINSKACSKNKDDGHNLHDPPEKKPDTQVCPICGLQFKIPFEAFVKHVEAHFFDEDYDSFADENIL